MNMRKPPLLAAWLLEHLTTGYHSESLAGDLFEEYQNGRSQAWFWRQTAIAVAARGVRGLTLLVTRGATRAILRFLTEAAALVGMLAMTQDLQQICSFEALLKPSVALAVLGAIALVASVSFYLRETSRHKPTPIRRRMVVFAITALSAGTLTWASTNRDVNGSCPTAAAHAVQNSHAEQESR